MTDVDDGRGFRRRRSAADDDEDVDAVSCVVRGGRDHLAGTAGLYSSRSPRATGDRSTRVSRWWTRLFCRQHDVVRRDDDDADDCWRLFPSRSRDADTVDVRRTSPAAAAREGDAALLTRARRCRHDGNKSTSACRRRVVCVIVSGLCVALAGLAVGAGLMVVATSAAYREYHARHGAALLMYSSFSHLHITHPPDARNRLSHHSTASLDCYHSITALIY